MAFMYTHLASVRTNRVEGDNLRKALLESLLGQPELLHLVNVRSNDEDRSFRGVAGNGTQPEVEPGMLVA